MLVLCYVLSLHFSFHVDFKAIDDLRSGRGVIFISVPQFSFAVLLNTGVQSWTMGSSKTTTCSSPPSPFIIGVALYVLDHAETCMSQEDLPQ